MAGVQGALFVPGSHKVALPRTRNGIAVFSMGSLIPESEALEFESAAHGESHTWRATREFALLGEILGSFEWGALDLLMFDLPPGAERTVQYADFLGPRTSFLLVTIPSEVARGVVARSVAALSKGPNRLLGYVENMSGYYCRDCNAIKPLFASPERIRIGPGDPLPRDRPIRSRACTALRSGDPSRGTARHTRWPGPGACRAATSGQPRIDNGASAMKFLCVPCDSPMKLQTVGRPSAARCRSSTRVLSAATRWRCSPTRTKHRSSSRSACGSAPRASGGRASGVRAASCPFTAMIPGTEGAPRAAAGEPIPVRWTSAAEARLANIPEFVRPMARTGIERFARERGALEVDEKILDAARDFFGM